MPETNQNSDSIQWLLEGYDAVTIPSILTVRQNRNVYFFRGNPDMLKDSLNESVGLHDKDKVTVVDSVEKMQLNEASDTPSVSGGMWNFEGIYQRSDTKNVNQRYYPRKLWESLIGNTSSRVQQLVKDRRMTGVNEHPEDGRTKLNDISILSTKLTLNEDGTVYGRGRIFATPAGMVLRSLTEGGYPWGVSSRGRGKVGKDGGVDIETFDLKTFDAVAEPSTPGALPKVIPANESVNENDLGETLPPKIESMLREATALLNESSSDQSTTRRMLRVFGGLSTLEARYAVHPRVLPITQQVAEELAAVCENMSIELESRPTEVRTEQTPIVEDNSDALDSLSNELNEARDSQQSLQEKVDSLSFELKQAENNKTNLRDTIALLRTELAEANAALSESNGQRQVIESRYQLALSQVMEGSQSDVIDPVVERRQQLLNDPAFAQYASLLNSITTVDGLNEAVATLSGGKDEKPEPVYVRRRSPVQPIFENIQCDENAFVARRQQAAANPNSGPSRAARAIKKMQSA